MPDEPTVDPGERLKAFLGALPKAPPDMYVNPPGLHSIYKVKWVRKGLDSGVLAVHHSGQGLCYVVTSAHVVREKAPCRTCPLCAWEWAQDREKLTPEAQKTLLEQMEGKAPAEAPVLFGQLD